MRVLVVERQTFAAQRAKEEFERLGVSVVGTARSSGEAWVFANESRPDAVVAGVDLESAEAGARLASKLKSELRIACVVAGSDTRVDAAAIVAAVRASHQSRGESTPDDLSDQAWMREVRASTRSRH